MKLTSYLIILSLIKCTLCKTEKNHCNSQFLSKCECGQMDYDRRQQYVVKCVDTQFQDTSPLQVLPADTEVLVFTGNHITELPWNVFGTLNDLKNLKVVDMSFNAIRDIPGKSYHHVTNVERLILNHNNLSIADTNGEMHHHARVFSNFLNLQELHLTNAFEDNTDVSLTNNLHDIFIKSNLTQLMKLHLEQNEIRTFKDYNIFCDLPSLRDLYLGDNFLTEISFNLTCLFRLRFIDLEHNLFKIFHSNELTFFDQLKQLKTIKNDQLVIDISKNPLICDRTNDLLQWIQKTQVFVRNKENLTCRTKRGTTELIKNYNDALVLRKLKRKHLSNMLLCTLIVVAVLLIVTSLIYKFSRTYLNKFPPVINNLSRKVHYTTIEEEPIDNV